MSPAILRRPSFQDQKSPPSARASTVHMPAPIKGWNTKDPVAAMDPGYAMVLDNWFPMEGEVKARLGWTEWVNGAVGGSVMSLMSYSSVGGIFKLFAGMSNGSIYDVSTQGTGPLASTGTYGNWFSTNFTNVAGTTYLWCANGVDAPRFFNGSSWTILSGASTPPLDGLISSINLLVAPWNFGRRIFCIEKGTMNAWYLPLDSIGGTIKKLPIGALFKLGGFLMAGASWTVDGGAGVDDLCVFLTSEGEMAVYQGDNPESSNSWKLVGVYFVGRPPSRRCFQKLGGDLAVLTEIGVLPMSQALKASDLAPVAMSNAIRPTIMSAIVTIIENTFYGAQIMMYPGQNALIINVPREDDVLQFVMNTITGAWCSFSGWLVLNFVVHDGVLYGGMANGTIAKMWDTEAVGDGSTALPVVCTVQTAFNSFGRLTVNKKLEQFRPHLLISKDIRLLWGFVSDYRNPRLTSSFDQSAFPYSYWDIAMWDVSYWNPLSYRFMTWLTATSIEGYALGLAMEVTTESDAVSWSGSDFLVEGGGLL